MKKGLKYAIVLAALIKIALLVITLTPSLRNNAIKHVVSYYVSNKNVKVSIGNMTLGTAALVLDNINFLDKNSDNKILLHIEKIETQYHFKDFALHFSANIVDANVNVTKFHGNVLGMCGLTKLSVDDINLVFEDGSGVNAKFSRDKSVHSFNSVGSARNIDATIPKTLLYLAPKNSTLEFLSTFILRGSISGSWDVALDLDKSIDDPNNKLTGAFDLKKLHLRYDKDFPILQDIDASLNISGTALNFDVRSGIADGVKLNGKVVLDLAKGGDSDVIIDATFNGPALGAIGYIPRESVLSLQKADIDLTKIRGIASGSAHIVISLRAGIENTYDVNAKFQNASLGIFREAIKVTNGELRGNFNGNDIIIDGKALVNDLSSNISYKFNLKQDTERDQDLNVKITCKPIPHHEDQLLSIISGSADIDLNYWMKKDHGSLTIASDLKHLEFLVDKISLYKEIDKNARLSIKSTNSVGQPSEFAVHLIGDDLKVAGTLIFDQKRNAFNFSKLEYNETRANGNTIFGDGYLKAVVRGTVLDLSHSHMMSYLKKNAESRDTNLLIKADKVKMKNDIWLDNFDMSIKCDKKRCYEGYINSNVGSRTLNMTLATDNDAEKWVISTTNAGAIMKAIGLYDNVKSGELQLTLKTSRQNVHAGEEISILDGDFILEKFVTVRTPFLTKLVSFVSFPGLMTMITGHDSISFTSLKGKFNYKDGVIYIKDCNASGAFFDFSASGTIDTNIRKITIKGNVVPSLYGINTVIKNLPIIGRVVSGTGHKKGILFAPYKMEYKY